MTVDQGTIAKHLSTTGTPADFVATYGPYEDSVEHMAEIFRDFEWTFEAHEKVLTPGTESLYKGPLESLMEYLYQNDELSHDDLDVRAAAWLSKYNLMECTKQRHPCETAKWGLRFLWMLCGGKENFGRILYAIVPTEGWPWVADEAEETRRRNQAMEDRVRASSHSPDGLPYDVRMNIAGMLMPLPLRASATAVGRTHACSKK